MGRSNQSRLGLLTDTGPPGALSRQKEVGIMRDSSFLLDSLTKLVDLRDKALAELKLELAEIIEEIISDRLQELAGLFTRGGD